MKKFLRYMLRPLAIISIIPVLGVGSYKISNEKYILVTSIIIYFLIVLVIIIKYLKEYITKK